MCIFIPNWRFAMKNKIALFFAMMLTGSVVMSVSASAESMYQDIIQFCKDNDEIPPRWRYTCSLDDAIKHLSDQRESLFNDMISHHASRIYASDLVEPLGQCAILSIFGIIFLNAPDKEAGLAVAAVAFGGACLAASASLYKVFCNNKITIYFYKKKIAEIDLAIEKLKAFREKQEQQVTNVSEQQ